MLIDSHCHLDFPALVSDRQGVIARAREAGIGRILNVCTRKREFDVLRATAEGLDEVFYSIGVHPHHVSEEGESISLEELVSAASHPKAVAIGEIGLDYHYNFAPKETQQQIFRVHLRAARKANLPVIIHSREAEDDTLRILKEEGCTSGVLHCFSSRRVLAEEGLKLGLYVSFSGILTFKNSQELRDIAADVPFEKLLVETDAPYLAPDPYRGKVCEPAYVVKTAEVLGKVKGVGFPEIARQTTVNFFRLFRKCPPEDLK